MGFARPPYYCSTTLIQMESRKNGLIDLAFRSGLSCVRRGGGLSAVAQPVQDQAVALKTFFFQEARDPAHGGGAGTGLGGDIAVGGLPLIEDACNHPAFRERLEFGGRAEVDQEIAGLVTVFQQQQSLAQIIEILRGECVSGAVRAGFGVHVAVLAGLGKSCYI